MLSRTWVLWALAFLVTFSLAIYQRATGPTYPLRTKAMLAGKEFRVRLDRSHSGQSDHEVRIQLPERVADWKGTLFWKRYKTNDVLTAVPMDLKDGALIGLLPGQPPAGKLQYSVSLETAGEQLVIPMDASVVIRFKGQVPSWILIPHVIAMFGAMLLATRTGVQALVRPERLNGLVFWTVGLFSFGGMFLGPVVQKFAFGQYWTGWPYGTDLTDNKTAIAWVVWLAAIAALYLARKPARLVLVAVLVMWGVYLIPHSMFGSELDYSKLDQQGGQ